MKSSGNKSLKNNDDNFHPTCDKELESSRLSSLRITNQIKKQTEILAGNDPSIFVCYFNGSLEMIFFLDHYIGILQVALLVLSSIWIDFTKQSKQTSRFKIAIGMSN